MAAIIHLLNFGFLGFVWEQKINILAGVFLGLAIYSYFYRVLEKKKKEFNEIIKHSNCITQRLNDMSDKSDIKTMLDAVAEFNNAIQGFKDNIIKTVKEEIKELENRLVAEISRTNTDVKKLELDVDKIRENANNGRTSVEVLKTKIAWAIGIAVAFSTTVLGILQYFTIKSFVG